MLIMSHNLFVVFLFPLSLFFSLNFSLFHLKSLSQAITDKYVFLSGSMASILRIWMPFYGIQIRFVKKKL